MNLSNKILKLTYNDPIIYNYLMQWQRNEITYQEAVELCVTEMSKHAIVLQNQMETMVTGALFVASNIEKIIKE